MPKIEIKGVGFLEFNVADDVVDIVDIFVNETERRKGYAYQMLSNLTENYQNAQIFLEVRVSNTPAIELYKKCNFKVVNIRKNYYENEDALLMKRLSETP